MEIKEIQKDFNLQPKENIKDGCELECPVCKEWSNHSLWIETQVFCELCGDHFAIGCPSCEERFDHTENDIFNCR